MAKVVVLGGGVSGLAAGLMLSRDGHAVTLLERDPSPAPASTEAAWERLPGPGREELLELVSSAGAPEAAR